MKPRCKNCEHCLRRKGLDATYFICLLKPMKDKPIEQKWFEKVKESDCCDKHEYKKGIIV